MKIFIAEDNLFYSSLLREQLESLQIDVFVFTTGEDCLKALSLVPDVVILSHLLEGRYKGLDILGHIKDYNKNIRVVYLTADENTSMVMKSLKMGAYEYVMKDEKTIEKLLNILIKIEAQKSNAEQNKELLSSLSMAITMIKTKTNTHHTKNTSHVHY